MGAGRTVASSRRRGSPASALRARTARGGPPAREPPPRLRPPAARLRSLGGRLPGRPPEDRAGPSLGRPLPLAPELAAPLPFCREDAEPERSLLERWPCGPPLRLSLPRPRDEEPFVGLGPEPDERWGDRRGEEGFPGTTTDPTCIPGGYLTAEPTPGRGERPPRGPLNLRNPGGVLLSQGVSSQVPSALEGLTAVFGMGTGVTPPLKPPEILSRVADARRRSRHTAAPSSTP